MSSRQRKKRRERFYSVERDHWISNTKICEESGKKIHKKKAAKEVANVTTKQFGKKHYIYQCRHCRGWHLTSSPPREK